jgi:GNAT superfamily N-acetyltransferase
MNVSIEYLADYPEFVLQIAIWYFDEWGHRIPGNSVEGIRTRLTTKLNRDRVPIPIVAIAHGRLIGTAQLKTHEMEIYPNREFWLGGVYVDLQARKHGIGKQLVTRVEEISKRLGIPVLFLQTERLDGGLYAKLGWSPLEQVKYHRVQVLVMQKKL